MEYFKNLEDFNCAGNQLTELDISKNTKLRSLDCFYNQLTKLDTSNNINLKWLCCNDNQLTELDVNINVTLESLRCYRNPLTNLDVSNNINLYDLDCGETQLKELDLSMNTNLKELKCFDTLLTGLKLNIQTYDNLPLYKGYLHGSAKNLSDLKNVTVTELDSSKYYYEASLIKVIDTTKTATYKVDGKEFTIIYTDNVLPIPPIPSANPVMPSNAHIFSDYNYNNSVTDSTIIIYGNGANLTIDGKKVNNKVFTAYTNILASYKYTVNSKGIVKPSIGKVIVGVTKSAIKPEVSTKNKITDISASNIAKAKIKNGMITVTAVGKESGLVYLWVIDTGSKSVSACCPIDVKLAPKKLEVQDTLGNKLKNARLENGKTLNVCVAGILSGTTKTKDCTYTATVDSKYQNYIKVEQNGSSGDKFIIKALGLQNNKDTKAVVTFKCNQNSKKINLSLIITK